MLQLIGSIIGFFVTLFAFNMLIILIQVVVGLLTGHDPDKRIRDQETRIRQQHRDGEFD